MMRNYDFSFEAVEGFLTSLAWLRVTQYIEEAAFFSYRIP